MCAVGVGSGLSPTESLVGSPSSSIAPTVSAHSCGVSVCSCASVDASACKASKCCSIASFSGVVGSSGSGV